MNTFVYFVRPIGAEGPVKIGCSTSPLGRLSTLMTWAPVPLEVVATVPGDSRLERRIHGLFADTHSHREWFHASPRLAKLMADLVSGRDISEIIDLAAPISPFRISRNKTHSQEKRSYLRYSARLRWALKPLRNKKQRFLPKDVHDIFERWLGRAAHHAIPEIPATPPTAEQFQRLEEFIANPELYTLTLEQRWPDEEAEAA